MYTCLAVVPGKISVGKFHVSFLKWRSKVLVEWQTNKSGFCKRIKICMKREVLRCMHVQHDEGHPVQPLWKEVTPCKSV